MTDMTYQTDNPDTSATQDAMHAATAAAREKVDATVEATKAQFSDAYARARDSAAETGETVMATVMDLMDRRRGNLAAGFRDVSGALHEASDKAGDQPMPRRIVTLAADALDAVAEVIDEKSTREMVDMVTTYGRTNPASFMVGSLLAGFAVGRLLTAEDRTRRFEDEAAERAMQDREAGWTEGDREDWPAGGMEGDPVQDVDAENGILNPMSEA
jgi:hypothetical protein